MGLAKKIFNRILFLLPRTLLIAVFLVYALFSLLSYFDYFERYLYPLHFLQGDARQISGNLIIGPYPRRQDMETLKKKYGITIILSLLNVNLPQEKALYERERKEAVNVGIKVTDFPMEYLAINGQHNINMLADIKAFLTKNQGKKIYIHCYLGRHRVEFVRKGLAEAGLAPADEPKEKSRQEKKQ